MPGGNHVSTMFTPPLSGKRNLGHFFGAIRIDAFAAPGEFKDRLQQLAEEIRAEPSDGERRPMLPGDPEKRCTEERTRLGIPIPAVVLEELEELADELGVDPLR